MRSGEEISNLLVELLNAVLRILAGLIYRAMGLVVKQAREGKVVKLRQLENFSLSLSLSFS